MKELQVDSWTKNCWRFILKINAAWFTMLVFFITWVVCTFKVRINENLPQTTEAYQNNTSQPARLQKLGIEGNPQTLKE